MRAEIDLQVVWSENKGIVQLFVGDFCIGLPPALCEQLENDLAAARRIPQLAREMAGSKVGQDMSAYGANDMGYAS